MGVSDGPRDAWAERRLLLDFLLKVRAPCPLRLSYIPRTQMTERRCFCLSQDAISRGVPVPCPPGELYLTAPSLLDALDPSLLIQQLQRNGVYSRGQWCEVHACMPACMHARGRGAECLHACKLEDG